MSNINAESVKAKLQGLITSANAKTGKSDANLTDAVNTLLEGYGQGGGGGECSGKHIIEVDELPEVGQEGAIYGVPTFSDAYIVKGDDRLTFTEFAALFGTTKFYIATITSDNEPSLPMGYDNAIYYVTDLHDIAWVTASGVSALSQTLGVPFKGEITDTTQATEDGYYAYMKLTLYQYTNGEFKKLVPESELPTEVATADEMTALLETAEVGSIYKYTGETTDTYENGALYVVEESE